MEALNKIPGEFDALIGEYLKGNSLGDLIRFLGIFHGAFVITRNGEICHADQDFADLVGYDLPDVIGKNFDQFLDEDCLPEHGSHRENDVTESSNLTLKTRSGDARFAMIIPTYFTYQGAQYRLMQIIDQTELASKNRELRQAGIIVENSPVILFRWKAEQGWPVEYVSPNILSLGYTADEFLNGEIHYENIIHPDDLERVSGEVGSNSRNKVDDFRQVYKVLAKDGSVRTVDDRTRIIRNPDGVITHYEGIILDISLEVEQQTRLQHVDRALRTLIDTNEAIIYSNTEEALLEAVCSSLVDKGPYLLVWIGYARTDAQRKVEPVAYKGYSRDYMENLNISWADTPEGHGPTGTALRTMELQIARDIHNDPKFLPWRERAEEQGFQSSIAIPFQIDNEHRGALNLYAAEPGAFDDDEVELLKELASDLAHGIHYYRVEQENREYTAKLRHSLVAIIHTIALTVEKRDPYTSGHMSRTAELCTAIARKLGLDEQQIEGISLGASVHDLGKIYIPAELLNKPGKLTEAEFDIIKAHPDEGYDILKDIDFPWPVADMVLQHHEKLDGSGYPQGLKGDEICLEAQILAIADVVEAVTSHRPYRPAKSLDEAMAIIDEGKGTLYNPSCVEACQELFNQDGFSFSTAF